MTFDLGWHWKVKSRSFGVHWAVYHTQCIIRQRSCQTERPRFDIIVVLMYTLFHLYILVNVSFESFIISRGAEGPGREILQCSPSVPSVCPSRLVFALTFFSIFQVFFAFHAISNIKNKFSVQKKYPGGGGGMLFEFVMNFLNIEKNKIYIFFFNISSFLRVSCYFQH